MVSRRLCPIFVHGLLKLSPNMNETLSMGKVEEAGTAPWGFCHRNKSVIVPKEAATFSAAPVLRTAAFIAEAPSDGDGVELSSPNISGIRFPTIYIYIYIYNFIYIYIISYNSAPCLIYFPI